MKKSFGLSVTLALCLGMTACAQPLMLLQVKRPASTESCPSQPLCVVKVTMSIEGGQCVYDLADNLFVPPAVNDIRWELETAQGAKQVFRFPAAKLPVSQKAGDKGPPFSGPTPDQREPLYTVKRVAAKTAGLTFYKMKVEYENEPGSGFQACTDLDPVIISMP